MRVGLVDGVVDEAGEAAGGGPALSQQPLDYGLGDRLKVLAGRTAGGGREGQQGEGLFVEMRARFDRPAVGAYCVPERPILAPRGPDDRAQPMSPRWAPGPAPPKRPATRIGEDLPRLPPRPPVSGDGLAGQGDGLMEPAAD